MALDGGVKHKAAAARTAPLVGGTRGADQLHVVTRPPSTNDTVSCVNTPRFLVCGQEVCSSDNSGHKFIRISHDERPRRPGQKLTWYLQSYHKYKLILLTATTEIAKNLPS